MNSKNQIEHARGILRYFSDTKKEEFPDLEELGNAFGLLARFVVLSKDEETFKITVELLKELLEESGPLMSGILDHDLVAVKDYVWSVDCGHLVNMQNIGIQSDSDRSRRLYEPMRRRRDRNHEPSIPASEIPKLHQMFYGFVQKCFNVLDLLVLEMKAAGVISYCLGKTDPWMFVVDLCKIQNRPEFDSIDAKNARILKNWCSLVRSTIVGSFFVLKNLDNEKKAQFFPILMNFALEHCDDCLMLNRTLESLKEDTCCEDLLLIQETIKLTLCRCISQGVVHVFYFIQKQTGSHFDDVDLKSRILDCIRRILFSLDLDSSFEFLTSILKLVTANAEHHCRETCPNSFLFDIFSEVHSMLKSDRSNWLKFIESCLADLPPGFCGCIPPQSLFFRLWFPVYGDELKAMKKLILKQFEEDFADDWEKKPVEIWKVDFGLGNWLKDSHFSDWKDMVEIIEVMNDILDEITKAEVIKILVNFYLANDDEDLREILLIFFFRQLNSEEMSNQIVESIILPILETDYHNFSFRIPLMNLLFKLTILASEEVRKLIIDAVLKEFSHLLKRALTDIWTFVSPSASGCFHAFCDLLSLFRHFLDTVVFNHHRSRILSDCNKLAAVCVDSFLSSDQSILNQKIAILTGLCAKCLILDKKSFARLHDKILESETMNVVLATTFVFYAQNTISVGKSDDFEPSFDADDEISSEETDSCITALEGKVDFEMVYLAMEMVEQFFKKRTVFEEKMEETKLISFFKALKAEYFDPENGDYPKIIDMLFFCYESVQKMAEVSKELETLVLVKIAEFVAFKPDPALIAKILQGSFNDSKALADVAVALQVLLEKRAVEPADFSELPQKPFTAAERPEPAPIPSRILPSASACFVLDPIHRIFLSEGMSVSFWLSIKQFSKSKSKQHVFSIGTPQLSLQVWIHCNSGIIDFILNFMGKQIRKTQIKKLFEKKHKKWENICLGLQTTENGVKALGLFGDKLIQIDDVDCEAVSTNVPFEVCLGEALDSDFLYEISSIFGFKGVLSPQCAIISRSLGCESQCLTECRSGGYFNCFSKCMTRNLIVNKYCGLLDVWSEPKKFVCKLQRNVLFVLQSASAHCYGLSVLQKGVDSDKLNRIGESVLCLTMYKDFPVEWHSSIVYRKQQTLDIALRAIGSVKIFIFLYALSVDKKYDSMAQLSALKLLFKALRRTPLYYSEFRAANGTYMLTQIMNTATAYLDDAIFSELCRFLFSELEHDKDGILHVSFYTIISEPDFLRTLISMTDLWRNENFKYWTRLIQLTAASIDTCKAKFSDFNSQLLHRVDFLIPLLHSLLDMQQKPGLFTTNNLRSEVVEFDEDEDPVALLTKHLVESVCAIVSELISSPFRCSAVPNLWNYILLSHPAQDTYLECSLKGHAEWIQLQDFEIPTVDVDSEMAPRDNLLSSFFERVLMNFDKDKIAEIWNNKNCVVDVRKEILKTEKDKAVLKTSATMRLDSMISAMKNDEGGIDLSFPSRNNSMKKTDHWLTTLRSDLLSNMCNIVLSCEDSLMAVIELDVLTWKTIIVQLTNQPNPRIRNLIFILLQNFFLRCAEKYRQEFVKQHGFLLLASQLRKYPVGYEIADSLFSIFCGECVKIRDGLDEEHLETIETTSFRYASFHSLFALLEASVVDYALFWTVCSTLQKIFVSNALLRRAMVDCGVVDTMMNVLRLLCARKPAVKQMIGPVFPLIDCWISFSTSIINLVIPYRDPYMYSRSEDFLWLCQIADYQLSNSAILMEPKERLRKFSNLELSPSAGFTDCAKQMVRRVYCQLIDCWLDTIRSIVMDANNMIPVDERIEAGGDSNSDDSAFEIYYGDSEFTSTSYYGDDSKQEKKKRFELASTDELSKRLCFGLQMANDLFIFGQIPEVISEKEELLFQNYLEILVAPWKKKSTAEFTKDYLAVVTGCSLKCRVFMADVIAYVLFPVQSRKKQLGSLLSTELDESGLLRRRLAIIKCLANELPQGQENLTALLEVNLDYQYGMKTALHELALCPQYESIWDEYDTDLDKLIRFLRTLQLESPLANLTRDEIRSLTTDELILLHTYSKSSQNHGSTLKQNAIRLSEKDNSLIKAVKDTAVALTCTIAELQNEPRKFYMQSRKNTINACAKANEVLASLVPELCHPEAPFYDASSWPRGFSLDPTENPHRERKRLKPDHYRFELRFLKKSRQQEVGSTVSNFHPLQNLCESCPNFATTDYIEASNHVRTSLSATLIRTAFECSGEIIISDRKIHFLGEEARSTQKGSKCNPVTLAWSYQQLSEVYYRFYLLKDTALELFTTTGDAFLIVFKSTDDRNSFVDQLKKMNLGNLIADEKQQLKVANEIWRRGNMTNFDYLMTLNKLAGRSFNDLMQYPVFPFILANYTSIVLDLNSLTSFRDLSRPMAVQNRSMEDFYIKNYNSLAEEADRHKNEMDSFFSSCFGAYHYGSHYSNTGIVAHYLVRVSPFTNVALEYQDNDFDIPDRLFNSIETTWRLSSSESTTDFKELIPEFFFLPEMFQNRDKLELGIRQAGSQVDDVNLPSWCPENNARLFCLIHRQALESQIVTNNLHLWIDLIFGFKQQGPAAVKAINVFHPATYRGRDLENDRNHDEISLSALRTMVRTYGQMPHQLFLSPHLPHLTSPSLANNVEARQLLFNVKGLKWGDFVGSPDLDKRQWMTPTLSFNLGSHETIGKLVTIPKENFCYGLPDKTELILRKSVDSRDPLRKTFETTTTAVVSWKFSDNVLRVKLVQMNDSVWINLIDLQMFEPTQVVFSSNTDLLFIGTSCGLIRIYSVEFRTESRLWYVKLVNEFFAHKSSISSLKICDDFHIILSTSIDAKACLWDSNHLTFVRTIKPPTSDVKETITLTGISSISADVAIVYQSGKGSRIVLFTVNGDVIGTYSAGSELTISSLAMTNMEEGTGINCLALGLQNGVIRLLETWTLSVVCDISAGSVDPVIGLEFGNEARRLYAALANGRVLCWQILIPTTSNSGSIKSKTVPNFRMINPFG